MEISRRQLRQKSAKISHTSSSRPSASVWTDAAKYTPPTPDTPSDKSDYSALRDYDLPIPSQKAIPGDYECDDDDYEKYDKVEGGGTHLR